MSKDNKEKAVLLRMENMCKTFPGVRALDNVSLTVKSGTVHALMGENGAGKSTLMKCLFGVYSADSGKVFLEGRQVNFRNSKEALENGVAMVHQELNQALKRSVSDNMWLGRFLTVSKYLPFTSERKMHNATKEIFDRLGLSVDPSMIMAKMPVSQRQMVEIAKAEAMAAAKAAASAVSQPFRLLEMPRNSRDRMTPELPRAPRSRAEAVVEAA